MQTMLPRILIVDDEPSIRHLYHRALDGREFAVTAVPSGLKALDLLDEKFSVIVTDYGMPKMDGVEFIRELRARGVDTPVIIVSGDFDAGRIKGALPPGIIAVLRKPFLIDELLGAIRMACGVPSAAEAQHLPND